METELWKHLKIHTGRILSQVDRDPDSPTYGCFDRNFWNYKIRDFASIIQQQGILVLDALYRYEAPDNPFYQKEFVKGLILGGVDFWSQAQLRSGAFNEYYPFESGFPPTAFSLYAVSLAMRNYPELNRPAYLSAINRAIHWLLAHPEEQALNQESAALAGIAIAKTIEGVHFNERKFSERLDKFYDSQSPEGWFNEYGGPDLGYLSVTIDSLWDIYQVSADERALKAAERASAFIAAFITVSGDFPVMINARNTDYIVPYGISGLAGMGDRSAIAILEALRKNLGKSDSMVSKTDDRYMTHYIGQSWFRSLLDQGGWEGTSKKPSPDTRETFFEEAGIYLKHSDHRSLIVSLAKGGIIAQYEKNGIVKADYGWRVRYGSKVAVTHWQNEYYRFQCTRSEGSTYLKVIGKFSLHGFLRPSPLKHILLRISAFLFGNRLMGRLKNILIFSQKPFPLGFERTITIQGDDFKVSDQFDSGPEKYQIYPAPHYSLRHVSSAGRFVPEELL